METATDKPHRKQLGTWPSVILPLIVLTALIVGIGLFVYDSGRQAVKTAIARDMEAIGKLKAGQIERWLLRRREDGHAMASAQLSSGLEEWLAGGMRNSAQEHRLLGELRRFTGVRYRSISLHSPTDGRPLLRTDDQPQQEALREHVMNAVTDDMTLLENIHIAEGETRFGLSLGFFSPIHAPEGGRVLAVLHVVVGPADEILPALQQWPGDSRSAEIVLVRRNGDELLYFHGRKDSLPAVRRPLATPKLVGTQLIGRGGGFLEGNDYRGVPVLAYGLPVPGSSWFLVAKEDREEALEQLDTVAFVATLLLGLLLLACGWWLVSRKEMENALKLSLEEIDDLYQNAPCGYHSVDADGTFVRMNDTELRMLGYSREEIVGKKRVQDLLPQESLAHFNRRFPGFKAQGEIKAVALEYVRKDGSIIPVLTNATAVRDEHGGYVMSRTTVLDMTERKKEEETLVRLNRALRLLGDCHTALIHADDEQTMLDAICRLAVETGGYRMAWVGFAVQDAARTIQAVHHFGHEAGYLANTRGSWADTECGRGTTGKAIRTGTIQITSDIGRSPGMSPWRTAALQRGYLSNIAIPLADKNGVFGALTIYASRVDAFGAEEVKLLEELANDLSFGIAALRSAAARKEAEKRLEASEERLQLALEASDDGILDFDMRNGVAYLSSRCYEMLDLPPGRMTSDLDFFKRRLHGEDRFPTIAAVQALLRGETPLAEIESRVITKTGDTRWIAGKCRVAERDPEGNPLRVVGTISDITEKKQLALELDCHRYHLEELVEQRTTELAMAKVAAEAATLAKTTFLANMSHEIRTPMNAIVGLVHLLQKSSLDARQAVHLDRIDAAASHLLAIINDILDLSKIEAGKLALEQAVFPLSAILDHVNWLIAGSAEAKGLTIEVHNIDVPLWLRGDATRLRQSLLNYASNAIKFTQRGRVRLRARLLEDHGEEILVRFEVQDTGVGIAAADLAQLFQPFQQLDVSTTRRHGGTGLGLVITQRLAALMGGQAGAESIEGIGSLFWFTARLGVAAMPAAGDGADAPESALQGRHAGARVLLAEDHPMSREMVLALLAETGLAIDLAENGREAAEMAAATDYDLILLDLQMPEMDGLEATRAIRALPGRAETPIVAMTANAFEEDRQRCLATGMDDFLAKPIDYPLLHGTLQKWLTRRAKHLQSPASAPAAGDTQAQWRQRLAGIPGLDVERVLKSMVGRPASYLGFLRQYAQSYQGEMEILWVKVAAGELAEAQRLAHSLKGPAGFLGFVRIRSLAAEVETALRERRPGSEIGHLLAALEAEQASLLSALLAALPEDPANHEASDPGSGGANGKP
ncbi:MAG: multi-sensor hybrid histidine kinase [Rhodocyclaceae bacterium]|nr:multi-sensor hybrid histidine kinase [Rhodocyclaceae bacterium]